MTSARNLILAALILVTVAFIAVWALLEGSRKDSEDRGFPDVGRLILGLVTNFLDTLGIGSFAPTTYDVI